MLRCSLTESLTLVSMLDRLVFSSTIWYDTYIYMQNCLLNYLLLGEALDVNNVKSRA